MRKCIRETINRFFHRSDKQKKIRKSAFTRDLRYECLEQRQLLSITLPHVGWLSVSAQTLSRPDPFTLSANNVQYDPQHPVTVSFFRDSNGNGVLDYDPANPTDPANDQLLGTGMYISGNKWDYDVSSVIIPTGIQTYFAQAADDQNHLSNVITANNVIAQDILNATRVANKEIDLSLPYNCDNGFQLYGSTNGSSYIDMGHYSTTSSLTIPVYQLNESTPLTTATKYWFKSMRSDLVVDSYSNVLLVTTTQNKPDTPTELKVANCYQDGPAWNVDLSWTNVNSYNNEEIWVEYSEINDSTFSIVSPALPWNSQSCLVSGLSPNKTYKFQIRSQNSIGYSYYSDLVTAKTNSAIKATVVIDPTEGDYVNLDWTNHFSGSYPCYQIDFNGNSYWPTNTYYSFSGTFSSGEEYTFDITPCDQNWNPIPGMTETVSASYNIYAPTIDDPTISGDDIIVSWSQVTNAENYIVQYALENTAYWHTIGITDSSTYSFTIPNPIQNGNSYIFKVGAIDVAGNQVLDVDWTACHLDNSAPDIPSDAMQPSLATTGTITTTNTSVTMLAADDGGQGNLTYYWETTLGDNCTFSSRNTGNNSIVTFHEAGTYRFYVEISDGNKTSSSNEVQVTVQQTFCGISIMPPTDKSDPYNLGPGQSLQLSVAGLDQFGYTMSFTDPVVWSVVSGPNFITGDGLYVVPEHSAYCDDVVIQASSGKFTALAYIRVQSPQGAAIDNGTIQLGVSNNGALVYSPDAYTTVGVRYLPNNAEGDSEDEGWGVGDAFTNQEGYATSGGENGIYNVNITPIEFMSSATTATCVAEVGNVVSGYTFLVTHTFRPSLATPNLYEIEVQIQNISDSTINDLRYRREIDLDVPPGNNEHKYASYYNDDSPFLFYINGYDTDTDDTKGVNPLDDERSDPNALYPTKGDPVLDYPNGYNTPGDIGTNVCFDFGILQAGQTLAFTLYYGAAGDKADALAALSSVGAQVYSITYPSIDNTQNKDSPQNTFAIGFKGQAPLPLYWDAAGTSQGLGGSGTWDTTSDKWHLGSADGPLTTWIPGSIAIFDGTPGTGIVTLTGSASVDSIIFDVGGYNIISQASGDDLSIPDYGASVIVQTGTDIISSAIIGNEAIRKFGNGTLIFQGSNTYTGDTYIYKGNLEFGLGSLPATGQITINSAGALIAAGAYSNAQAWINSGRISSASTGALALIANEGNINLHGTPTIYPTLSIGAIGNVIYTGTIIPADGNTYHLGGGGGTLDVRGIYALTDYYDYDDDILLVQGPGTVIISGTNELSGGTTVISGTLQFGDGTYDGSVAGNITVNSGANIIFNDSNQTYAGIVSGQGNIEVDGTLILINEYDVSGNTTIYGTLQIGDGHSYDSYNDFINFGDVYNYGTLFFDMGYGYSASIGGHMWGNGETIIAEGSLWLTGTIDGNVTLLGNGSLYLEGNATVNGVISITVANDCCYVDANVPQGVEKTLYIDAYSQGDLVKEGPGSLAVTNVNDWYCNYQVYNEKGTLTLYDCDYLGNIENHATLNFDVSQYLYCDGVVSGDGNLILNGGGALLINELDYSGAISINDGGSLWIGQATSSGSITVNNGGCLVVAWGNYSGSVSLGQDSSLVEVGNATISGSISGQGSVIVGNADWGSGNLALSGLNTYTGDTVIFNGTLELTSSGQLSTQSLINVNADGTFLVIGGDSQHYHVVGYVIGDGTLVVGERSVNTSIEGYLEISGLDIAHCIIFGSLMFAPIPGGPT